MDVKQHFNQCEHGPEVEEEAVSGRRKEGGGGAEGGRGAGGLIPISIVMGTRSVAVPQAVLSLV